MVETLARQRSFAVRLLAMLSALALAVSFAPPMLAKAAEVTGGSEIDADGIYEIASGASGTIAVGEDLEVTIVGKGDQEKFAGLNIQVGNGTTLTIQDLYADQGGSASTVDFLGNGTLEIAGENLIDNVGGLDAAVIHVAPGNEVHFAGTGTLYGYKSALCSYIGGNNGEANGKIVFDGGCWFVKGTKTGAVIGGDSPDVKGDDIVINGGELYVKGVAKGALIGGSNQGKSGDVYVNGGLVELFEDFSGPAIGAGNADNAGNVYVTGGSLKTTLSSNSANAYGEAATFGGMPGVSWKAVKALNAADYEILAFDASAYIEDMATDTVDVYIDNAPFYSGRAYTYVTNEVKNPNDITGTTKDNWLENDVSWLVTLDDYGTSAYPSKNGSSLVPEKNLYLALTKENHTLSVNGQLFEVTWDDEAGFSYEALTGFGWYLGAEGDSYIISSADELAELAQVVNGTVPAAYGIAQDDFVGKTVTLGGNIDLSAYGDWTAIGTSNAKFGGTFDGAGCAITGLSITSTGGYKGLFGNNSGTVKNFTLSGALGSEESRIGGGDYIAGAVAFNTGEVSCIVADVNLFVGPASGDTYSVAGIVGCNDGGTISQCGNNGSLNSDTSKSVYRDGGVCGYLKSGTVTECYNTGDIEGWNYRNGNQGTGGVVGSMDNGAISFCYNTGTIRNGKGDSGTGGKQGAGGIVGASAKGDILNSYAVGDTYGPASSGIVAGKYGTGNYDHLYSLDTARAYQQYGTKTDENGIKYMDGSDEAADGSLILGGAALARDYNSGSVVTNSYTKSAAVMQSSVMVVWLNTMKDGSYASAFAKSDGGFPILAWQGAAALNSLEITADNVSGIESAYASSEEGVAPEIAVELEGTALTQGADYTVSFATKGGKAVETPLKDPGSYVATIAGTGSSNGGFYGTVEVEFAIRPTVDDLTIAPVEDQTYTGKAIKPAISITYPDADGNEASLVQGTDFSVKYKDNKVVGEATAIIVGSDNYDLNRTVTFNIVPANLASGFTIADIEDQLFEGTDVEPPISLTNDATGVKLVEDEDYFLTYFNNDKTGTASVKATGKGNYTGSTKQKEFTIFTADLAEATAMAKKANFTGKAIEPVVTVTYNGKEIPASAYAVSCDSELVNVGTYTLKIAGNDVSTSGETTCEFVIDPKAQAISASNVKMAFGKTATVPAKLTEGDGKLSYASSDKSVVKVDAAGELTPVKVGTAKVTVSAAATDNYAKATRTVTVTVTKAAQPMTVKAKAANAKAKTLMKKAQTIKVKKAFTVSKAKGKVTYKKANKVGGSNIVVAKNGNITLKKGLKKGNYKVKVKVTAAGNANYKSGTKTVTVKITVK